MRIHPGHWQPANSSLRLHICTPAIPTEESRVWRPAEPAGQPLAVPAPPRWSSSASAGPISGLFAASSSSSGRPAGPTAPSSTSAGHPAGREEAEGGGGRGEEGGRLSQRSADYPLTAPAAPRAAILELRTPHEPPQRRADRLHSHRARHGRGASATVGGR